MLRRLVLAIALMFFGATAASAEQEVTPAQIENLKERIEDINEWLADAENDRSSLEQQLVATERKISKLTRERRALQKKAKEQQSRLDELKQEELQITQTLNSQRESLKRQIRAAWMESHTPAVKVLLNEIDSDKIARTMVYYEYLSRDTVSRLEAFQKSLATLRETRSSVKATRIGLANTEAAVARRQSALVDSRKERKQTLATLNSDIHSHRSERDSLKADQIRLQRLLDEVQEAIANIPSPNESQPFGSLRKKLPWPVKGKVLSAFGDRYADGKLRRDGLLITTKENAEVTAIHYGRVVFANWLRGFGLMTIIDHGDGYMTLYGHSSSLFTSPGDWVAAGEPIALAGQTGGTNSPALYFEIRHNGKPDNPERWLAK